MIISGTTCSNQETARLIREAFDEGYHSYVTPACAYNTVESAWDESQAKQIHDNLLEDQS